MTPDRWKAGLFGLLALMVLEVACPLLAARSIPLVDPDEGLHASIALGMVESGDWLVPRLCGEPFLDKPILYFWAIAGSIGCFGASETAVRLPGLLFGMLGAATTALVAWRVVDRRTGLLAGVLYSSMIVPLALVQIPAHDVALVPWVNLALLAFWESDRCKTCRAAWGWTALAGAMLGLAILTKGLAGVALTGIAYGGYLIVSLRLRPVHCLRAVTSLVIAVAIGSTWYIAVEQSEPGFVRYYFFERHVLGFLTKSQPHGSAPWWYYFPILLIGGLPWIAYLPVLLSDAVHGRRSGKSSLIDALGHRPVWFVTCWLIGCTLFLTVSKSKLVTYIWPVFPAIAILAALVWARRIEGLLSDGARRWMSRIVWTTCLVGPFALPATFTITQIALPTQFSLATWVLACLAALTSLAPLWSWRGGRIRLTVGLAAAIVCGQLAVLLLFAFPQVAEALSGRDLAEYFNRARALPTRVLLAQERVGSVIFYLDRDLRGQLRQGQIANQDIDDPLPTPSSGKDEWIAIPERHLHTALNNYDLAPLPYERAGRFRLYRRSEAESHVLPGRAGAQPSP